MFAMKLHVMFAAEPADCSRIGIVEMVRFAATTAAHLTCLSREISGPDSAPSGFSRPFFLGIALPISDHFVVFLLTMLAGMERPAALPQVSRAISFATLCGDRRTARPTPCGRLTFGDRLRRVCTRAFLPFFRPAFDGLGEPRAPISLAAPGGHPRADVLPGIVFAVDGPETFFAPTSQPRFAPRVFSECRHGESPRASRTGSKRPNRNGRARPTEQAATAFHCPSDEVIARNHFFRRTTRAFANPSRVAIRIIRSAVNNGQHVEGLTSQIA